MKKTSIKSLVFLVILSSFLAACAKKPLQIGREHPELEIKKCVNLSEKKLFKEAVECLEVFKSRFPKSEWGLEAELYIGDNYFKQKEYLLAADSYEAFIKLHPTHHRVDYAYYKMGLSYLKETPKAIDRDQEYLDAAISNFKVVLQGFTQSAYYDLADKEFKAAREKIARRHFYVGRFYYRTGEYIAAIPRFKEVLDKFSESLVAERSAYLMTISNLKLKRIEDAKESFSGLATKFPQSKYIPELEKKLIKVVSK